MVKVAKFQETLKKSEAKVVDRDTILLDPALSNEVSGAVLVPFLNVGVQGRADEKAEGSKDGKKRVYDRGGERMAERVMKDAAKELQKTLGTGMCEESKAKLLQKNKRETREFADRPEEREKHMRKGQALILSFNVLLTTSYENRPQRPSSSRARRHRPVTSCCALW